MTFDSEYDGLAWLVLILRAGGLLVAGVAVVVLLRHASRGAVAVGVAVATVAVASSLFLPGLRDSVRAASEFERSNDAKVEAEKRLQCTTQATIDAPFFGWALRRMQREAESGGPSPRYHLVLSDTFVQIDGQFCIRYLMLPATQAPTLEEANWVLFYEELPSRAVERAQALGGRFITPDETQSDRVLVQLHADRTRR